MYRTLGQLERVQAQNNGGSISKSTFNSLNHLTETPHIGCYLKTTKGAAKLQGYNDWAVETAPSVKGNMQSHSYINNSFKEGNQGPY